MKPNGFISYTSYLFIICLIFTANAFGQETDKSQSKTELQTEKVALKDATANSPNNDRKNQSRDERYRIGFQDTIQVDIQNYTRASGQFQIEPNGTIRLFRIDEPIVAVCKTERELANEIAAAYSEKILKNPYVKVSVVDQKSQAFGVIGAVEKPGYYYMNRKVHLLELLAFAGGPSELAGTNLIVARTGSSSNCQENALAQNSDEDPSTEVLNYKIKDVQKAMQFVWMKPGDIVSILEADPFYVQGNVNKPGMFLLKGPMTLTQAIATAEGYKPSSKKDYIRILRTKPNSTEREELIFRLKDIEEKKVQDPLLEANDIVAVSEDKVKSIMNSLGKALTGGIPSIFYRIP